MENISKNKMLYVILSAIFCFSLIIYARPENKALQNNTQEIIVSEDEEPVAEKVVEVKVAKPKASLFSLKGLKDKFTHEKSFTLILILAFLIGILTSFTPCVYPLIPITLGILQAQATQNIWRNFMLSLSYVFGISFVYAILGYVAATTTLIFGQWLGNPWVISFIILIFLLLISFPPN